MSSSSFAWNSVAIPFRARFRASLEDIKTGEVGWESEWRDGGPRFIGAGFMRSFACLMICIIRAIGAFSYSSGES